VVICGPTRRDYPGPDNAGRTLGMAVRGDAMPERIRAFDRGGGVVVKRVNRGYSLVCAASDAPIARLRPTGTADEVEVLWWRRKRWAPFGPFGRLVLPLDEALACIASEPAFRISARSTR
jgi:hypothetical protein